MICFKLNYKYQLHSYILDLNIWFILGNNILNIYATTFLNCVYLSFQEGSLNSWGRPFLLLCLFLMKSFCNGMKLFNWIITIRRFSWLTPSNCHLLYNYKEHSCWWYPLRRTAMFCWLCWTFTMLKFHFINVFIVAFS